MDPAVQLSWVLPRSSELARVTLTHQGGGAPRLAGAVRSSPHRSNHPKQLIRQALADQTSFKGTNDATGTKHFDRDAVPQRRHRGQGGPAYTAGRLGVELGGHHRQVLAVWRG